MKFDFSTIISYESVMGKVFDPTEITTHTEQLVTIWCTLSNENPDMPGYMEWVRSLTPSDFNRLSDEVIKAMKEFYMPALEPENDSPEDDDKPKNVERHQRCTEK